MSQLYAHFRDQLVVLFFVWSLFNQTALLASETECSRARANGFNAVADAPQEYNASLYLIVYPVFNFSVSLWRCCLSVRQWFNEISRFFECSLKGSHPFILSVVLCKFVVYLKTCKLCLTVLVRKIVITKRCLFHVLQKLIKVQIALISLKTATRKTGAAFAHDWPQTHSYVNYKGGLKHNDCISPRKRCSFNKTMQEYTCAYSLHNVLGYDCFLIATFSGLNPRRPFSVS